MEHPAALLWGLCPVAVIWPRLNLLEDKKQASPVSLPDGKGATQTYMVKDHEKDAKEFKDAADDVKDPDLKAFAQKTHAVIEEHLRLAREMEASVK